MTNHQQTIVEKVDESAEIHLNVSIHAGCLEDLHVQTASQEVRLGVEPAVLQSIAETGVAISVWQRGVRNDWQAWLTQLPSQTCRVAAFKFPWMKQSLRCKLPVMPVARRMASQETIS